MSDIIDKTPPNAETLKGRIHLLGIPTHIITHYDNEYTLSSSSVPFNVFSFEHTGRVCGYIDSNKRMYLIGSENVNVEMLSYPSTAMWCGFNASSDFTAVPAPPSGWSGGYAQESNVWRIGMKRGSDYNLIEPLSPNGVVTSGLAYGYDSFSQYLSNYKHSGSDFVLSTDISDTIAFNRMEDFTDNFSNVFNTTYITYSKAINAIHDLANIAYGRLGDTTRWEVTPLGSGGSAETDNYMNMVASNLIITHDLESAKKYVADGTIPSDYDYDDPTKGPSGGGDAGDGGDDNNGGEGDSGSDHRDDVEPKQPTETAMTLSNVNLYALEKSQLQAFINDICSVSWAEISINTLTGIYNNLTDSIQSIRVYPFAVSDLGSTTIVDRIICGFFEHTANVNALTSDISIKTAGSYDLKEVFGGWADYAPYTDIDLYLPYIGYTRLDTNLFMKHSITVKYTIDVLCGVITYFVLCDKTTILIKSAKICADVPISLASGIDTFTDVTKNVASFGGSLASKRPVGMLTGSSEVQTPEMVSNATESGIFYMPTKCAIKITRPSYTRTENYDSRFGYPCYGAYKLSNLAGFTVVENYKSHYTKGIKKDEEDMIKSMMESGVYL